jgi:hypothetical protein
MGARENVSRRNIAAEIKPGEHSDAHVVKVNGSELARDNPDGTKADNVNRGT